MKFNSNFLIISPHPDDEILGCGGLIKKIKKNGGKVSVIVICNHLPPLYTQEEANKILNEMKKCHQFLNIDHSINFNYQACLLNKTEEYLLNNKLLEKIISLKPSYVFIPFPDRHQDHKIVFESAMVATRPKKNVKFIKQVYCYETVSETFWNAPEIEKNFIPDTFVNISNEIDEKLKSLKIYSSQVNENDFERSFKTIKSLSIFRGSQVGYEYAESFKLIRSRFD
jgi:LmbE family N-acetylglucosaminyl deacetylase